jgi:hypothetical protein
MFNLNIDAIVIVFHDYVSYQTRALNSRNKQSDFNPNRSFHSFYWQASALSREL